jgi:FdhD protein
MIDVVCALILQRGRVLLAQRRASAHMPECWEFAGGKLDPGEQPVQALHRELMEELGCEVTVIHLLPPVVHEYARGPVRLIPFICELKAGSSQPQPLDHQALQWSLPHEIVSYDLAPADVPVLQSFLPWYAENRSSAVLLAGGRSRRMGRDKALLRWQGQPLWQFQMETLRGLGLPIFVAAREEQALSVADAECVQDPAGEDLGPMPAILRSLQASASRCLVLAVDMPMMTAEHLRQLLADSCAVIPRLNGELQPLCAIYSQAMIPLLQQAIAAGQLGLQRLWLKAIDQGLAAVQEVSAADHALFANWNEPDDVPPSAESELSIIKLRRDSAAEDRQDLVAVEEPLEIRVEGRSLAVVMRTPGHDSELAAGFLVSEGVVARPRDILEISQCQRTTESRGNVVDVLLGGAEMDWEKLTRHVFSASSCGICGKTSLDSVFQRFTPIEETWTVTAELLWQLPDRLRAQQQTFSNTGGLHACALFDQSGELHLLREDVGRHNALDKLLGHGAIHGTLPFSNKILLLSGRVSFEMMQKALAAGIPIVAAISAPTSLAVQFAKESGQTLVGFLRPGSMNIYSGAERVTG